MAPSSASPAAEASDAVEERLSSAEQSSSCCRAEELVKELSAESRKMEASVLGAPGGGGAAWWKDCVLGSLQDGHAHAGAAAAGSRGVDDDEVASTLAALVWKREPKASFLVTICVHLTVSTV